MILLRRICMFSLFVTVTLNLSSGFAAEHPGYIDAPERRTTGIGKFYMDREISFVMGHHPSTIEENDMYDDEQLIMSRIRTCCALAIVVFWWYSTLYGGC